MTRPIVTNVLPQNVGVTSTLTLTAGDDVLTGTAGDDIFTATEADLNLGDILTGGEGNDTLQLNGGGNFNLRDVTLNGIQTIKGSSAFDYISIDASQLQNVRVIDGNGGVYEDLLIYGTAINLAGKTVSGFSRISLLTNGATITVDNVNTALAVDGSNSRGDHLILVGGSLTDTQRAQIHARGVDTITAGGVTTTNTEPVVANLDGDRVIYPLGAIFVRLDTGAAARLTDDDTRLTRIIVKVTSRQVFGDAIGIDTSGGSITLSNDLWAGSLISIDGTKIGSLDAAAGNGQLYISLNTAATPELVQTLLRGLTYYNLFERLDETLQVKITVSDPGGRESASNVTVIRSNNEAPGPVTLDSAASLTVMEKTAFSSLLSATDDLTPASSLTFSFDASAAGGGNAGGLFVIEGNRLKLAPGRSLDYEALAPGQKFVTVHIKATDSEDGVGASRAITINVANDPLDDGTDGPDTLIGDVADEVLIGKLGNDVLWGNGGDDHLFGNGGNDKLYGGAGDDTLNGGLGKDVLKGEAGKDVFVFDTKPNAKTNVDQILDFDPRNDKIALDHTVFKKLGKVGKLNKGFFTISTDGQGSAKDKNDYVIYDSKAGKLFYDADGNGAKAPILIATLKKNLKGFDAGDFLVI
ncbi:hypothetical protein AB4072_12315 [Microvirga sp. 2MCAF38]|uniref:hypothetical protein n=1 Tax=Microvirga sp. 2MCAF38 TaxID=3232989 RepID=UPI003F9542D1